MKGEKTGGRVKGTPNKNTNAIKEAYQKLIEANLSNMTNWLKTIAKDNPVKAFELMTGLSEYVLPKMARTELTGKDGEELKLPIPVILNVKTNPDKRPSISNITEPQKN